MKTMIVLGVLALIYANAGFPPSIMHAAMISSSNEMESIVINSSIKSLSDPGDVYSAQARNFPTVLQDTSVKVLSPAQPLGSLEAITWNTVAISDNPSVRSESLKFPEVDDLSIQLDAIPEKSQSIDNTAVSYTLPMETNRVEDLFYDKSYEEEVVYCTACHSSPNIGVLTKITHLNGRFIDQQGDPASMVSCVACHKLLSQQTLWHIRGVE